MADVTDVDGRLLPHLIDGVSQREPDRVIFTAPHSENPRDGFYDVSARRFANGINRVAHWLESQIGRGTNFPTIGYIGPQNLFYGLLMVGAQKTGHKCFFLSPRNSLEANLAILEATDCQVWVVPPHQSPMVTEILEKRQMKVLTASGLEDTLDPEPVPHYKYEGTWERSRSDPSVLLHTSGSTGFPKPITLTLDGPVGTLAAIYEIPEKADHWISFNWNKFRAVYSPFPWFHAAGLLLNLAEAFFSKCKIILGPPNTPVNLALVEYMSDNFDIDAWLLPPSIIEELAVNRPLLDIMKERSNYIMYGGGAPGGDLGDIVNKEIPLVNIMGTTEAAAMPLWIGDRENWRYMDLAEQVGADFREVSDGVFELWLVRKPECEPYQTIFKTFPTLQEFSTKDIFVRHPTKPNLWLLIGRTDDVIVLTNGEKIQPVDMEHTIAVHPAVRSAMVVGTRRFQAMVLLELAVPPPSSEEGREKLLDSIYEQVHLANHSAPSHARILRSHMLIANPDKPFLRTVKGNVKRFATNQLYEKEINEFYEARGHDGVSISADIDVSSIETITDGLKHALGLLLEREINDMEENMNAAGLNSLLIPHLLAIMKVAAEKHAPAGEHITPLTPSLIYNNPTIRDLAKAFYSVMNPGLNGHYDPLEANIQTAEALLQKYTTGLPAVQKKETTPSTRANTKSVLLTGTTGSLGSYLLNSLLEAPSVDRIYCLNRSDDAKLRQVEASSSRGLVSSWSDDKVEFLKADMSAPYFGLGEAKFTELGENVTNIIHNQWAVNFNWHTSSFEPQIRGVANLVKFSAKSKYGASIFFISSIGTIANWKGELPVPETSIHDLSSPGTQGYGSSKLISEMLLEKASQISGVDATVCRVGQIGGPVNRGVKGSWNKQEWFPTIIATSVYLGLLPSSLGSLDHIDWIPVDILADIILELDRLGGTAGASVTMNGHADNTCNSQGQLKIFHTVNPKSATWSQILPAAAKHMPKGSKTVTWEEWLQALREVQRSATPAQVKENPGLKLLDFYESLSQGNEFSMLLDTKETQAQSALLRELPSVSQEWMDLWLKQWGY